MKTALITGVSGQDGSYLAAHLLARRYRVVGTSRREPSITRAELGALRLTGVEIAQLDLEDTRAVERLIVDLAPDEIYHLAGQTSVGLSFAEPAATYRSLLLTTLNVLDTVRARLASCRVLVAGSGEVFGDTHGVRADETTRLAPRSPYAAAKAAVQQLVETFRTSYGTHASTAILYNHESPRRPLRFVTRKVVRAALDIAAKRQTVVQMGALGVVRDWGWAPEYVTTLPKFLERDEPADFVLATGRSHSLEDFVRLSFEAVGLDFREHVRTDPALLRPSEIPEMHANPERAERELGFRAQLGLAQVVERLVRAEVEAPSIAHT